MGSGVYVYHWKYITHHDYDANGNMVYDGANDLSLSYNHLNLVEKVSQNGVTLANYSYLADGTKLSALDNDGNGLVYAGSLVYRKQNGVLSLESGAFPEGRFMATEGSNGTIYTPLYHLTDHLGSIRAVVDGATGEVIETNDYYPFGMRWQDPNQPVSDNRYRYNAKEEQNFLNLPYTDYGARMRDPKYGISWNGIDPLSEVTPGISPFAFCLNNPIKFLDPDGRRVSVAYLSKTHQRSLQTFMGSKTGMAFISRYMDAGQSLVVNGQTYTFDKAGDRAKDLLMIGTQANMDAEGNNTPFVKGTSRPLNQLTTSEVKTIVKDGVKQQITLSGDVGEKKAVTVLGHEAFVHADKDADALTQIDNNPAMQTPTNIGNIPNGANADHQALGNGKVTKFKQSMSEISNQTGDKYYEQEYQRQVNDYKNRTYSDY